MSEEEREPDDLSAFCCQSPDCPDYGRRGRGNLTAPMRYRPRQRRPLRCKTCEARFSERKGTPLLGAQPPRVTLWPSVGRENGTDRNRNAREGRKTYCFSKGWDVHEAVSYFTPYSYNFCRPVRAPRQGSRRRGYRQRTPAMAAGLTDHVWTLKEWLCRPAVQRG